ncbi:unnamed protein product [Prorocentrum cordatum]|uniref:Myosin motor domain-containing protein n=1 Tax=Prorocentrum cordatum TaxID=2364126 RepID=A0ABN9TUP7_9DINO|nr:unnamed protein product [Polarella glacialis]
MYPDRVWQVGQWGQGYTSRNRGLAKRCSGGALSCSDLGHLPLLHEPAILHALQLRFKEGLVYTLTGPVLLAVNPFRELPGLYGAEQLARFAEPPAEEVAAAAAAPSGSGSSAPHIYGVAQAAYYGVWHRRVHQTVLVSGESGAGKTETTKFVMRFLALAGGGGAESSMSDVERQVLQSIPVLEAMGNAKTLRNETLRASASSSSSSSGAGPPGGGRAAERPWPARRGWSAPARTHTCWRRSGSLRSRRGSAASTCSIRPSRRPPATHPLARPRATACPSGARRPSGQRTSST